MGEGGFARLRAGRSAALACHRHAIHYRSPSNPPFRNTYTKAKTPSEIGWCFCLVGEGGFEPPKSVTTDLQSAPFDRSGIPPYSIGAGGRIRTPDLLITNQLLYQLSYTSSSNSRIYLTRRSRFCQQHFLFFFIFLGRDLFAP